MNEGISAKEIALAASMLKDHSSLLGSAGCNDWDWPEDWTSEERVEFVRAYHEWNGDPGEFDPEWIVLPDFAVAAFLAHKLEGEEPE